MICDHLLSPRRLGLLALVLPLLVVGVTLRAGAMPAESGPTMSPDRASEPRPLAPDPIDPARNAVAPGAPIRVDGAITEAIEAEGWADVLVALADGVAPSAPLADLARGAADASADLLADLDPAEFRLTKTYSHLALVAGRVSAAGLPKLRAHPRVLAIDEDVWVYPLAPAAGPMPAPAQLIQSVASIEADKVHAMGIKGQGVAVAVLDTGIDNSHPDFEGAIVDQYCYSSNTNSCVSESGRGVAKGPNAQDEQGHGTGVSGIVLGRGRVAPAGVAPEANLVALRVFRDQGGAPTNDIVDGLNFVVANQAKHDIRAVNMSLGGGASIGTNCDNQFGSVKQVFQTLLARNVAIFVATGNGGNPDRVAFPGCISNGTGVGSTFDTEMSTSGLSGSLVGCHDGASEVTPLHIACYTDRGRSMALLAPGSFIVASRLGGGMSGDPNNIRGGGHGTSYASPAAAGVAALLFSADPGIHARDMQRILERTGDTVIHPESGDELPRVNAYRAILSVLPETPTPVATATDEPTATPVTTDTPEATATGEPATLTPTSETPPTEAPTQTPSPTWFPTVDPSVDGLWIYLPFTRNGEGL